MSSPDDTARPFVHLRVRSAHSLLRSTLRTEQIVKACLTHGCPAVAVTDEDNLFGALEFSTKAVASGVQPIMGATVRVRLKGALGPDGHARLALLAADAQGYTNLMRLVSLGFLEGVDRDGVPNVLWQEVLERSSGLICLTAGREGPVSLHLRARRAGDAAEALDELREAFGDRLYVELQRHGLKDEITTEAAMVAMAYERDLPLVATNDVLFAQQADAAAHDALICIAEGSYLSQADRPRAPATAWFRSSAEMAELFSDLPEALDSTLEIARLCAVRARDADPMLPRFEVDTGLGEDEEMGRQAREGLRARLAVVPHAAPVADYEARLEHEIDTIARMGFSGYFLIVSDFIKWAKAHDIPVGPGRGSGAGSAVAWALQITDLDPLRFGLLFERFLNIERISMPDFDVDFCQERREEVIEYVKAKYGADRVAQIITFGSLQARAVVRDVGRVMQLPYGQINRFCKLIPHNPAQPVTLARAVEEEEPLREEIRQSRELGTLVDVALQLEGLYRNASTHAAGIVIANRPLDQIVPLFRDPRSPLPATQFNMKWVDKAGLVKFDFLGLKTLTVIDRALRFIRRKGVEVDLATLPLDDAATYELLASGHTLGVFQLESQGMRDTLRKMRADSLEDIIALISLYRPGPMKNIDTYVDVKFGRREADYLHPLIEPILRETYGVIIYQEQVMQIAQVLSGYSLGKADLLRRAMGKKNAAEMEAQQATFIEGATARGVAPDRAAYIFQLVQEFAGYGFNKSHAAAYALIAYQTAWLKANHPVEFMAASMSLELDNTDKLATFAQEARRMGISILPPCVNASSADFDVSDGAIRYALGAVRNVGLAAMEGVVEARRAGGPFGDLADFARRVDARAINRRLIENLAKAGAFDAIEPNRARAHAAAEQMAALSVSETEERRSAQNSLFAIVEAPRFPAAKVWNQTQKLDHELAAIGFYLSGHPLSDFLAGPLRGRCETWGEAQTALRDAESRLARMVAIVRDVVERTSKQSGERFAYVRLSDPSGEYEVMVRAEELQRSRPRLQVGTAVVFECRFRRTPEGDVRTSGEKFEPLAEVEARSAEMLRLRLDSADAAQRAVTLLEGLDRSGAEGERRRLRLVLSLSDGREIEIAAPGRWVANASARSTLADTHGVMAVQ